MQLAFCEWCFSRIRTHLPTRRQAPSIPSFVLTEQEPKDSLPLRCPTTASRLPATHSSQRHVGREWVFDTYQTINHLLRRRRSPHYEIVGPTVAQGLRRDA